MPLDYETKQAHNSLECCTEEEGDHDETIWILFGSVERPIIVTTTVRISSIVVCVIVLLCSLTPVVIVVVVVCSLLPLARFLSTPSVVVVVVAAFEHGPNHGKLPDKDHQNGEHITENIEQTKQFGQNAKERPTGHDQEDAKPETSAGPPLLALGKVAHGTGGTERDGHARNQKEIPESEERFVEKQGKADHGDAEAGGQQ